jgi:hypothetical protein
VSDTSAHGRTKACDHCGGTGRLPVRYKPRARKFERVIESSTGAGMSTGVWGASIAILSRVVETGDSPTLWECSHPHKGAESGHLAALRCARREARRRGWELVPIEEYLDLRKPGWREAS